TSSLFPLLFLTSTVSFFFQAEDGIRDRNVTGVQTCALPICGCKVSWALRGGVRLLREPRRLFRLAGDTHSLKMRVTGGLFATVFAPIPPPTGRENPPDFPGLSHLQICGFSDGDGGCRVCAASQFTLSASHRSVARSCPCQQGED